jgi:hypothetical protein
MEGVQPVAEAAVVGIDVLYRQGAAAADAGAQLDRFMAEAGGLAGKRGVAVYAEPGGGLTCRLPALPAECGLLAAPDGR